MHFAKARRVIQMSKDNEKSISDLNIPTFISRLVEEAAKFSGTGDVTMVPMPTFIVELADTLKRLTEQSRYNRNGGLTLVPMPGFVELAHNIKKLIEEREKDTPVDIVMPEFDTRSNKEPVIRLGKEHIGGHDCVILTSGPGSDQMLNQLLLALGYLVGRRAARISVVTGYLPLGRSDKDEGALEFALASHVTHMIIQATYERLDRIIAPDLHAPQIVMAARLGSITEVTLARRVLKKVVSDGKEMNQHICLLLPDDGASKKFTRAILQVEKELDINLPVVCGQKRRDSDVKSKLLGLAGDTESIKGALVIGFDDEIATGSTTIHTAEAVMKQYGAAAYWAAAVHGVLCGEAPKLLSDPACPISKVYITDTIPPHGRSELDRLRASDRLVVVPWAEDLAHIVYYHHWDISIREMR
jgi:ribose-phosphate pyrophosphokinase